MTDPYSHPQTLARAVTTRKQLPRRTRHVHEVLLALAEDNLVTLTLAELAKEVGISRQALHPHMSRLRKAGLVTELGALGGDDHACVRLRRVTRETFTNPVYTRPIHTLNNNGNVDTHNPKGLRIQARTCSLRSGCAATTRTGHRYAAGEIEEEMTMQEAQPTDEDDFLGGILQGGAPPRPVVREHLPDYPGVKKFRPVQVPRMPRLNGDTIGDARLLVRAYKACVLNKYGKRPRVDKQAHFRMRRAAATMLKAGVTSPYAWAAFRMRNWQYSEKAAKKRPGIDYVFSSDVVTQHYEHYSRRQTSHDVLDRRRLAPSHARLLDLWKACEQAARSPDAGPPGEQGTLAVVSTILPPTLYAELAAAIPGERSAIEADLFRRLAAGDWIW